MIDFTPADFATEPADHAVSKSPDFYLCIRYKNWMLTREGLFRWGSVLSAKTNKAGRRAKRYGWKRLSLPFRKAA